MDALFGARGQSKLLLTKAAAQELRRVQLEEEDEAAAVAQTEVSRILTARTDSSLQLMSDRTRSALSLL